MMFQKDLESHINAREKLKITSSDNSWYCSSFVLVTLTQHFLTQQMFHLIRFTKCILLKIYITQIHIAYVPSNRTAVPFLFVNYSHVLNDLIDINHLKAKQNLFACRNLPQLLKQEYQQNTFCTSLAQVKEQKTCE